jgi:hypothetical protein
VQAACHATGRCRETPVCVPLGLPNPAFVYEDTGGRRFGRLRQDLAACPASPRARSDRQFALVRPQDSDYPRSTALAQLLL